MVPESTAAVFRHKAGANGELCRAAVWNRCEGGMDSYEHRHVFNTYICPNQKEGEYRLSQMRIWRKQLANVRQVNVPLGSFRKEEFSTAGRSA